MADAEQRSGNETWARNARKIVAGGHLLPQDASDLTAMIGKMEKATAAGDWALANLIKGEFGEKADAAVAAAEAAQQPAEEKPISEETPAEEEEEGEKEKEREKERPKEKEQKKEKKGEEKKPGEEAKQPGPEPEGKGPTPGAPEPTPPGGAVVEGGGVPGAVAVEGGVGEAAAGAAAEGGAAAGGAAAAATGEAAGAAAEGAVVAGGVAAVEEGGAVVAVGGGAIAGGVWVLIAILILGVLFIVVVMAVRLFMGFSEKSVDLAGGSITVPMDYSQDAELQKEVQKAVDDGSLVFADPELAQDIKWQDDATAPGGKKLNLDRRVMITLEYLARKWSYIRVNLSYSNGPDLTRRYPDLTIAGVPVGTTLKALIAAKNGQTNTTEPYENNSAFHSGQAVGIDQIGRVSQALGNACFGGARPPVQVSWQEVAREDVLRGWYEQMQVDASDLFKILPGLVDAGRRAQSDQNYADAQVQDLVRTDGDYVAADRAINNLLIIMGRVKNLGAAADPRTAGYLAPAVKDLTDVQTLLQSTAGADRVKQWGDKEKIQQPIRDAVEAIFRAMQVANMNHWRGDTSNQCRLWKAYEARQNIRQLVLDMMRMPLDAKYLEANQIYNTDLAVKQLIVYSPEDDLDNGLPDLDVFPTGAVAVDEGGVGYDDSARDGLVDSRDNHFMALPVDNGVFSKADTIFVYKDDGAWNKFKDAVSSALAYSVNPVLAVASAAREKVNSLFSGAGLSVLSGDKVQKVTFKNFVQIGF